MTFASAFLIEGLGTWISIIGLSSLFSADPIIIALAGALDVGKIVTVSFLYKRWGTAPKALRLYMILATAVLMAITSAGAFGYLSAAFQGAIKDTKQQQILVTATMEEQAKLEARKKEIDAQIANLPAHIVKGRQKLIGAFKGEADRINLRLRQLEAELPRLRVQQININTHAGPIVYVSQAFDVSVEQAVKYVILVIIFVFDPLAIALLIAGNFLWETRKRELRVPEEAALQPRQTDKTIEPLQEARADLPEVVPDAAAMPVGLAEPVGVSMPKDDAPGKSVGIHDQVERQPIHLVTAQDQGGQPGIQPTESTSPAQDHAALAEANTWMAMTAEEQIIHAPDPEQVIRETAYYLAEKRQFKGGAPADDWVQAEKVIAKDGNPAG
ncbi:DUF2934 domain-containing protein [Propionivibrio sp.]|uniref:DUF2934 domain-containing protein n=1 Tax=Propionivibrio sp. TaxID=2212460 RepID=UPI003BF2DE48